MGEGSTTLQIGPALDARGCGGDADTLDSIVGGIVAARVGIEAIPERWRRAVEPLPIRF